MWANTRFRMETENVKGQRFGGISHHHWHALAAATHGFAWLMRALGLYERGARNAMDLVVRTVEHRLARLPAAFDGMTILHLSDLHIDAMPGLEEAIQARVGGLAVDLCVLTGDYRGEVHGPIAPALEALNRIVAGIPSRLGHLGILGNHDSCQMVDPMERMGVRMLINETVVIEREGQRLAVIGTDDVHWYFTDQAVHALEDARHREFSIALVHSPEMYDVAAGQGVDLYLCGHTHAGQICLPGGHPIVRHLNRGREYYRDLWQYRGMHGFTHAGTGTSGIALRYNTRGEIVVHRLLAAS
jgi:hypothetical protein